MPSPFSRLARRTVRATQNMISQIVVSVGAAVCVAFITSAYLDEKPATIVAEPKTTAVSQQAAANRQEAAPGPETQAAARSTQPLVPTPLPALDHEIITDLPVRDVSAVSSGAEIFPGVPAESTLAETLRDTDLAASKPERRRFLGLPLPYFVPTAGEVLQSATAAGGKLVSLVERQ
jgi:hypothetical protein